MTEAKTTYRVLVLPGDHVGSEVMQEAIKVLSIIQQHRPGPHFELDTDLAGGCSIDAHVVPITEEVLAKAEKSDAVLFGSVGGPEWADAHPNPESCLLELRQSLDHLAFANLRPCVLVKFL